VVNIRRGAVPASLKAMTARVMSWMRMLRELPRVLQVPPALPVRLPAVLTAVPGL
jgi:hypothetical protein